MSLGSPSATTVEDLVFWSGDAPLRTLDDEETQVHASDIDEHPARDKTWKGKARERAPSLYVTLCEEMIDIVLDGEAFLFSADELAFFRAFRALTYNARFLLIRLLLRKADKWHRLDALNYAAEIGSAGIQNAIAEMCKLPGEDLEKAAQPPSAAVEDIKPVRTAVEIIDLTLDDDLPATSAEQDGILEQGYALMPAKPEAEPIGNLDADALDVLARDERSATLGDLLGCLSLDELKSIAKKMKLAKTHTNRAALTGALITTASSQSTLHGYILPSPRKAPPGSGSLKQATLPFTAASGGARKMQADVLRELAVKTLTKCVRINGAVRALFKRLHIVLFRSTQHPTAILTPALLACFRKRAYPAYTFVRTPSIFVSRDALLAYEDALVLEAEVDALLDGFAATSTPGPRGKSEAASVSPVPAPGWKTPVKTSDKENSSAAPDQRHTGQTPVQNHCDRVSLSAQPEPEEAAAAELQNETHRMQSARRVLRIFERVYPRWQELVKLKGDADGRANGLERFDEGWILTRIVAKGAYAYGVLKHYAREVDILEELLSQPRWRRGRRGGWYERWALVLMHHLAKGEGSTRLSEREVLEKAKDIVIRGLEDRDTHVVWRPALERRLTRLEKRLKVPLERRHTCAGALQAAEKILVEGIRMRKRSASVVLDRTGRVVNNAKLTIPAWAQSPDPARASSSRRSETPITPGPDPMRDKQNIDRQSERWKGKSIWVGKGREEVNVETLALQHYEAKGYKGFHSEGRIVSMIFGLLFWDVLFSAVPGAFETPYQSAPLDIAEDTFYHAREAAIEERLAEIEAGRAAEILAAADDRYRPAGTWCVGVRWDAFEKADLVEIAKCLGGQGLSNICRVFCEDYSGRGSGVPDLLVWKMHDSDCKFVEVKGPGDTLQENQKVWIDVLLQSGITVELCSVAERGQVLVKGKKRKPAKAKKPRKESESKTRSLSESDEDTQLERPYVESEDCQGDSDEFQQDESVPTKRRRTRVFDRNQISSPVTNRKLPTEQ